MNRAVIYARVSTPGQADEETPIAGQVSECRRYCEDHGYEVVGVYQDEGVSGKTDARPDFQKLIAAAKVKPRPFDMLVCRRGSRLFRRLEHYIVYKRMLKDLGVRVLSIRDPEGEGATGELVGVILSAIYEFQATMGAEDTLAGLKEVARQGFSTGGRPPIGYVNERRAAGMKPSGEPIMRTVWVPNPDTMKKVKRAFQMTASGAPGVEIIEQTGICSSKSNLSVLLRNRAYLGERVYNRTRRGERKAIRIKNNSDDILCVPGSHPAIITPELFNQVQAVLDKKRPRPGAYRPARAVYALSGLLWCAQHDEPYTGHTNGHNSYYACALRQRRGKKAAACAYLRKEEIEHFIVDALKKQVLTKSAIRKSLVWYFRQKAREHERDNSRVTEMLAALAQVQVELERFYVAIQKGIDADTLQPPIRKLKVQQKQLEAELAEAERERDRRIGTRKATPELVAQVQARLHALLDTKEPKELKAVLHHFIERIIVDGQQLTIRYTIAPDETEMVYITGDPGGIRTPDLHRDRVAC